MAPEKRFHDAVAELVQPDPLPRLTQEQAEVLAIAISDAMATRRRIGSSETNHVSSSTGRVADYARRQGYPDWESCPGGPDLLAAPFGSNIRR